MADILPARTILTGQVSTKLWADPTIEDGFIPGTSVRRGLRLRFPEDELDGMGGWGLAHM